MEQMTTIIVFSAIIWFIVDNLKANWGGLAYHSTITKAVVAALSAAVIFNYNLDMICAIGLTDKVELVGQFLTIFVFMVGSGAVEELFSRLRGFNDFVIVEDGGEA